MDLRKKVDYEIKWRWPIKAKRHVLYSNKPSDSNLGYRWEISNDSLHINQSNVTLQQRPQILGP
jgi:hypothetical protein